VEGQYCNCGSPPSCTPCLFNYPGLDWAQQSAAAGLPSALRGVRRRLPTHGREPPPACPRPCAVPPQACPRPCTVLPQACPHPRAKHSLDPPAQSILLLILEREASPLLHCWHKAFA